MRIPLCLLLLACLLPADMDQLLRKARAADLGERREALREIRKRDSEFVAALNARRRPEAFKIYGDLLGKVRTPAVRDWVAEGLPKSLDLAQGSEAEFFSAIGTAVGLCLMDDERGGSFALEAYKHRDAQVHRGGETILLLTYKGGGGDWTRWIPEMIEALHPEDSDAAELLDGILGVKIAEAFALKYEANFTKIQEGFRNWWKENGKTFDPVRGAFDSLRVGGRGERMESYRFLQARLAFDAGYSPRAEDELRQAALAKWEAWYGENRDYLVWDAAEGKWIVDEEAKKAGVPAIEYRKAHPRDD